MHALVIFNLFVKSLTLQFQSVTELLYTRIMCRFRVTYIAAWDLPAAEMKIRRKLSTTKIQKYMCALVYKNENMRWL